MLNIINSPIIYTIIIILLIILLMLLYIRDIKTLQRENQELRCRLLSCYKSYSRFLSQYKQINEKEKQ